MVGRAASCRPVSVIESWTVDGRVKSPNPLSPEFSPLTETPTLNGRTGCCERGGNPRFVDRKKPLSLSKLRLAARRLFTLESLFFAALKTFPIYVYIFRGKLWVPLFFSAGRSSPAHPTDCHREKDERLRDDSGGGGFGAVWLGEGGVWDRATTTKAAIIIASQLEVLDVEGGRSRLPSQSSPSLLLLLHFPSFFFVLCGRNIYQLSPFRPRRRGCKEPLIYSSVYVHQRPSGHHSSSFHMWKRLFSMQFAAALKHEERERERAEISAPRHRKYHSFRARVSSSCSSWVSAAALPASQRRLNRKKDCFRTKEEKKREERKEERKRFAKLFFFFLSPTVDSLEAYFFFLGGKRGVYLKALSSQFQTLLSFSSFFCPKITTVC